MIHIIASILGGIVLLIIITILVIINKVVKALEIKEILDNCEPSYIKELNRVMKMDKPIINWEVELNENDIFWPHLVNESKEWVTCACGNQCVIIPRNDSGSPVDRKLFDLGVRFHRSVVRRDKKSALKILNKIEERSAYLIKQIKDNERLLNKKRNGGCSSLDSV